MNRHTSFFFFIIIEYNQVQKLNSKRNDFMKEVLECDFFFTPCPPPHSLFYKHLVFSELAHAYTIICTGFV